MVYLVGRTEQWIWRGGLWDEGIERLMHVLEIQFALSGERIRSWTRGDEDDDYAYRVEWHSIGYRTPLKF